MEAHRADDAADDLPRVHADAQVEVDTTRRAAAPQDAKHLEGHPYAATRRLLTPLALPISRARRHTCSEPISADLSSSELLATFAKGAATHLQGPVLGGARSAVGGAGDGAEDGAVEGRAAHDVSVADGLELVHADALGGLVEVVKDGGKEREQLMRLRGRGGRGRGGYERPGGERLQHSAAR